MAANVAVEAAVSPRWRIRVDGEWGVLNGPPAPAGQEDMADFQDLRIMGVALNAIFRLNDQRTVPYILAGFGGYRLQREGATDNPNGTTGAVQAGIGVGTALWNRVRPFLEARIQLHATDYGIAEFGASVVCPIIIGISLQ